MFGCVRVVWNDALAICKQSEKLPSNNDLQVMGTTEYLIGTENCLTLTPTPVKVSIRTTIEVA
jgi:hypothetical protein